MKKFFPALFILLGYYQTIFLIASPKEKIPLHFENIQLRCIDFNNKDSIIKKNKNKKLYQNLILEGYSHNKKLWFITALSYLPNDLEQDLRAKKVFEEQDKIRGAFKGYANNEDHSYFIRLDKKSLEILDQTLMKTNGVFLGSWDYIQVDKPFKLWLRKAPDGVYDLCLENLSSASYEDND